MNERIVKTIFLPLILLIIYPHYRRSGYFLTIDEKPLRLDTRHFLKRITGVHNELLFLLKIIYGAQIVKFIRFYFVTPVFENSVVGLYGELVTDLDISEIVEKRCVMPGNYNYAAVSREIASRILPYSLSQRNIGIAGV